MAFSLSFTADLSFKAGSRFSYFSSSACFFKA
jgi:hypothetical protein